MTRYAQAIQEAAAAADFGVASARKRGRNPEFPYVPVIEHQNGQRTANPVKGLAFATRAEAVAQAQRQIDAQRAALATKLGERRYRALREQYGLPRELETS